MERTPEKNTSTKVRDDHGVKGRHSDNVMKHLVTDQCHVESFFPIFIRAWSGKTVCMLIQNSNTIQEIKSIFQARELVTMEEAMLNYEGKLLIDIDPFQNIK